MWTVPARLVALVATSVALLVVGVADGRTVERTNHHSVKALLRDRLHKDGTHKLHKKGDYAVSVEVKGGKIASFHVKHPSRGEIAVQKYKTSRKMASLDENPKDVVPAAEVPCTQYIGFAFTDDTGETEYYWIECDLVIDPSGAIEYVPVVA